MSVKTERQVMVRSHSPLSRHSLNQERLYNSIRMEKKAFGGDRKAEKSRRRKQKRMETKRMSLGQIPEVQVDDMPLEPTVYGLKSGGLIFTRTNPN